MSTAGRARDLLLACILVAPPLAACEPPSGAGYTRLESERYLVWMTTQPRDVPVSREFVLEVLVCPKRGGADPELRVDALMPAHRHGMNARASVTRTAPGRWRAEGLLFHMPGRWQFVLELDTAQTRERITSDLTLE